VAQGLSGTIAHLQPQNGSRRLQVKKGGGGDLENLGVAVEGLGGQETQLLAAGCRGDEQLREALAEQVASYRLLRVRVSTGFVHFQAHASLGTKGLPDWR